MNIEYQYKYRQGLNSSAIGLLEDIANKSADECWNSCLDKLNDLGVNSLFYGYVTSNVEIERVGMTAACHFRTNHNPEWCDLIGIDNLIDSDLTSELIFSESREVLWFDETLADRATPEQLEQSAMESELGMQVGISLPLDNLYESSVMSGVGLCTGAVSTKEFSHYWGQHRSEVLDICHVLDFSMRYLHKNEFVQLTRREIEFLTMLAGGYSQKQIAGKWKRSLHTLDHHSRNCRRKLKAGNLEQAVYKAFVLGLIKP